LCIYLLKVYVENIVIKNRVVNKVFKKNLREGH
jgi:hypothetical protein